MYPNENIKRFPIYYDNTFVDEYVYAQESPTLYNKEELTNIITLYIYLMNKILILSHLGLGDNIFCIPMIIYYLNLNYIVHYICAANNMANFKLFFEKSLQLSIISVKDANEARIYIDINKNSYNEILKSGVFKSLNPSNLKSFPFFQYDDIHLSRNILKQYFVVPDTQKSEELFEYVKNYSYVVINNQSSTGGVFNIETELNKYNIDPNNTLIINTQTNYYTKENKYYSIAQHFVFKNLIDYKKTLVNAKKILLSDSSMFCLAIQLELNSRENKVYVRGGDTDWKTLLNFYDNKFTLG